MSLKVHKMSNVENPEAIKAGSSNITSWDKYLSIKAKKCQS